MRKLFREKARELILIAVIFGVYGPGFHPEDFIYVTF